MNIKMMKLDAITPYESNPRDNDHAVGAVAASLQEFGWQQPIVVDKDHVIIVGHTRYKAAIQLGMEKVPVHIAENLTDAQARAYRIADNQTGSISTFDWDKLKDELKALETMDIDMSATGFTQEELDKFLGTESNPDQAGDPDNIPAPMDEAITQLGDIIILGKHRLMCGDSSDPKQLDKLLAGAQIHLCNTDPPYNVAVEPRSNNAIAAGFTSFPSGQSAHLGQSDLARHPEKSKATHGKLRAKDRPLENDAMTPKEFDDILLKWFGNIARVLLPGRAFYIWGGYGNTLNYRVALEKCELFFHQSIIWNKQHPVLGRKDFMNGHEWCFYGWREGAGHQWFGPNNVSDIWDVKKLNHTKMVHLTEKPVELAERAMEYSSQRNENVLDLFGGSGSTMIAAERKDRNAYLMELDPQYCDVIVKRWEDLTGKKAKRKSS